LTAIHLRRIPVYEKKKILVICGSAVGQMYLGVLLNRIGYMPVFSRTAGESFRLVKDNTFSLILLDGDLPELDRSAAVSLLRNDPLMKLLPLVVILTTENKTLCESLIYAGCTTVISKPLDVSLVYGILGRLSGEPRQAPRIPVRMRVEIKEQIPDLFLTSVNISESGIYLRTHEPLPENAVLHLTFTLPNDSDKIKVVCEVARKAPLGVQFETEPGIGLRFTEISEDAKIRIRNLVKWSLTGDLEWEPES
jgi:CheY-like chemotaxis protein